jgi:hypothetical protein
MDVQLSLQWLKTDYKSFDMNLNKPTLHLHIYLALEKSLPPYYKLRVKEKKCKLLKKKFTIYLNVNKALIIHFENIF